MKIHGVQFKGKQSSVRRRFDSKLQMIPVGLEFQPFNLSFQFFSARAVVFSPSIPISMRDTDENHGLLLPVSLHPVRVVDSPGDRLRSPATTFLQLRHF
jgi:hypothetical protein